MAQVKLIKRGSPCYQTATTIFDSLALRSPALRQLSERELRLQWQAEKLSRDRDKGLSGGRCGFYKLFNNPGGEG